MSAGGQLRFAGHVALISGAGRGIGAALARALVRDGAKVLVSDLDLGAATALAKELGPDAAACQLDVTQPADWQAAATMAQTRFGGLSLLFANAGIACGGAVDELDLADWHRAFAVHADGAFHGIRAALPLLSRPPQGVAGSAIVAIASAAARHARGDMAAYGASKAALVALIRSVALHCAHRGWPVRANSVLPAYVDTPMLDTIAPQLPRAALKAALAGKLPLGRLGAVDEVVEAALFLASDAARFITGSEIAVDGGLGAAG